MAGYLINLDKVKALEEIIKNGVYSTNMKSPKNNAWGIPHEGTFADYLSMEAGDLIYFFVKRKIYGCGQLIDIGIDCKYLNYLEAGNPHGDRTESFSKTHLLETGTSKNRCFCTFIPHPVFFKKGMDMDAILQNKENPFRSVRTFWNRSFIKLDNDESTALFNVLMKYNENEINNNKEHFRFDSTFHNKLKQADLSALIMHRDFLISNCTDNRKKRLKHEMALEASLCEILSTESRDPFGKWDYVSHQVPASPFKPIDYMDKMDIFGYRYIPNYEIKSKYLIAELKKDNATIEVIEQLMKYVDWVSNEYANKDYSMIEAYIVAADFPAGIKEFVGAHCIRNFTKGFRPTEFCVWNDVKLVKYSVQDGDVVFSLV